MINQNTPKLRFKNFDDEWTTHQILDIADRFDNLRVPITSSDRNAGSTPYYGANGIQDYVQGFTHDGEFVLIAEDGANDLKDYPVHYVEGQIWVNNHAHVLSGKKDKLDNTFFKNRLKQSNFEKYLVGGSRAKLNADILMKMPIKVPSLPEQSAIGALFQTLDELLSAYKDNLANYQAFKASMLSKMFPKAGQTTPEIRLDGFDGEWEEKKLGDTCQVNSGRDYKHLSEGNIPVYGTGGYMLSINDKLSDKDAIGIGRKGTIDKPFLITAPFWTVDTLFFVTSNNKTDLNFLFQIFNRISWKKYDESTGVPSLSKKTIQIVKEYFPSLEEQKAIGDFFSSIDDLISSCQEKIEQLETLKKKLLQDMFV
ncbi:restriction endonuclease subunit S [Streptococcus tangpeifui]|uniref:restriction endonuclease subunit S n=1 Tax=Streptococcus tangpeifui TaxID=2709400 RepID=UPI0013E9FB1C|nr:restriction endonuclease subunit S [Streptococcus sp. ZJ373]